MADQQILTIDLDTSQFDAFKAKFDNYQAEAKVAPDPFMRAASSLHEAGNAITGLQNQFGALAASAGSSRMTGPQSFISQWQKQSHLASQDWARTAKSIDTSRKDLTAFARSWLTIKPAAKLGLGLAGLAGGVIGSAAGVASDVAADNKRNRELGLQPGEVPAFDNTYKKYGLSDSDIETTRNAQQDPKSWRPFMASGLNQQQIQGMDPAELTAYLNKWAGGMVRQWQANGQPIATMAKAYGLDGLLSNNQLRLAGTYSDSEHDQSLKQFRDTIPQFAIDQKKEDQATEEKRQWDNAWTSITRDFQNAFLSLTPQIVRLATEATKLIDALARSPELKADLDDLANGVEEVVKFLHFSKTVNSNPANQPDAAARDYIHNFGKRVGSGFLQSYKDISAYLGGDSRSSDPMPGDSTLENFKNLATAAEKKYSLPAGITSLQMAIESRFRPNAENPKTHAAGLLQLMPDTYKSMHVDPWDPAQNIDAGGKVLRQFLDKWHGNMGKALANFNGDGHIAADTRKYDSWIMGARDETKNYLRTALDAGYDLGLSPSELEYLKSNSKGLGNATNDASLKTSNAAKLDLGQAQIIEEKAPAQSEPTTIGQELHGVFKKLLGEGAGARFATQGSKSAQHQGYQQAPTRVDVRVNAPAGASTNVTVGGLPR